MSYLDLFVQIEIYYCFQMEIVIFFFVFIKEYLLILVRVQNGKIRESFFIYRVQEIELDEKLFIFVSMVVYYILCKFGINI